MEKVFENGNERDGRTIMIKIKKDVIEFFFYDKYRSQEEWIKEETERRFENGEDELYDDEKEIYSFYWIPIREWVKDKNDRLDRPDNWHTHMKEKAWFSHSMEKFINENTH